MTDKMTVSFGESATNENLAPNEEDGNINTNTKRTFNAHPTPHPKKKPRSIDEDDDSDTAPPIQPGDGADTSRTILFGDNSEESEAIEKKQDDEQTNDTAAEQDEQTYDSTAAEHGDDEQSCATYGTARILSDDVMMDPPDSSSSNNNTDSWWEKTAADILKDPESLYCENLQNFQEQGLDRRAAVRDRLLFVMEGIKTKLDEITEHTTNGLAAQLYENYASNIEAQEDKILQLVRSNQACRVRMVEALEKANLKWESNYSNLMNRVVFPTNNNNEEEEVSSMDNPKDGGATDSQSDSTKTLDGNGNNKDKKKSVATKDDSLNSESQDPDWDEVIRFAPHCEENIRSFLEVREKWKAVSSRYIKAIASSHERLQANIMKTINTVYETFQDFDERMDDQQYDIQKLMADNHERRQKLQQALEESALQAKGLFARLMARVSSIRAPGKHS